MLDHRAIVPLSAAAGLAIVSLAWLGLGRHASALAEIGQIEGRFGDPKLALASIAVASDDSVSRMLATPLFALTTGPGAVTDAEVRLLGLAITPERKAALLSINGKPAVWLAMGAGQDGVTLMDVQSTKVTLDTETGFKEISLWDGATAGGQGGGATASATGPAPQTQAGYRLPPAAAVGAH